MLAQQLRTHANNGKRPTKGKQARFYMFSYLLDEICIEKSFPNVSWMWTRREPVVHIYCKFLSECSYKGVIKNSTDHILIPLYMIMFWEEPPCISCGEMKEMLELANWFALLDGTFLRVFSCRKSPHLLLSYAIDKLVMQEVSYHISIRLDQYFLIIL